jgi:hypothetical protein
MLASWRDVILQTSSKLPDDGDQDGSTVTERAITAITERCEHVTDNQTRHPDLARRWRSKQTRPPQTS